MSAAAETRSERLRPRHLLTIATIALVVIGCLAVLSAASGANTGSAFGYFAKAAGLGTIGCILMAWLGRGGPGKAGGLVMAHRLTGVMLALGFAGVLFVMVPTSITPEINGARAWIVLPGFTIQPSELLKLAIVLYLATSLAREPWRTESLTGLRPPLLVAGAGLALVAKEDLGTAIVIAAIILTMLFLAGTPGRVLLMLVGAVLAAGTVMALISPERVERLAIFLHPFDDRYGAGFQVTNGLMAIGSGGLFGEGLGESWQKYVIPEPQTDFILAVIMEEVGLLGATAIMALYVWIVHLGLRIARGTEDPYERLVAAGISSVILWQAALNIWVVLGMAPLTGVPLPLISAGSTSQLILLGAIGLLIDIDRRSAMPTVSLVTPQPRPQAQRQPVAAPEPEPGELRVVDRRPEPKPKLQPQQEPVVRDQRGRRGKRRSQSPAPAAPRAQASTPAPQRTQPSVIARTSGMEIRSDGTVRLPDGRIGRPKKPIVLPDGRVLLPGGEIVSRELAVARSTQRR